MPGPGELIVILVTILAVYTSGGIGAAGDALGRALFGVQERKGPKGSP